jgi:maleylacetoacetate isomerase
VFHEVDLYPGAEDQGHTDFREGLNPSEQVPVLVVDQHSLPNRFVLTQTTAILEYFEETFPNTTPLLPPTGLPLQRARVRELMAIITHDMQQLQDGRITDLFVN